MTYGLIPRISMCTMEYERVKERLRNKAEKRFPDTYNRDKWIFAQLEEKYPELCKLHSKQNIISKISAEVIRSVVHTTPMVNTLYKKMQRDGLIKDTWGELLLEWADIDERISSYFSTVMSSSAYKLMKDTILTESLWRISIEKAASYMCHNNCLLINIYSPMNADEWRDFYFLVTEFITLASYLYKDVKKSAPVVKPSVVKVVDERLTLQVQQLRDKISAMRAEQRKMAQETAAYYNPIIKRQAAVIAQLQGAMPQEVTEQILEAAKAECVPLPKDDVTFVAGHQDVLRRVTQEFPGWTILDIHALPSTYPENPICFLHTSHQGHSKSQRLCKYIKSDVLYCHYENIDRLIDEMQMAYTNYIFGGKSSEV